MLGKIEVGHVLLDLTIALREAHTVTQGNGAASRTAESLTHKMIDQPIKTVKGDYNRKWFTGDDFDLIVWYTTGGKIHGFQFCYEKPTSEKAFTWLADRGFSHMKVDDGELDARGNQTPILLPAGRFPAARIKAAFQLHSHEFPAELCKLVLQKIDQYKRRCR